MDLENIFVDQVISYMKKINFEPYKRTQLMESIYLCDKFYNCVEDIIEHINKQNLIRQELTVFIHSYELINEDDFAFKNKIKDLVRTLIENNGYNIEKCKDFFVKEKIDYIVNLLRMTLNDPNNAPKHIHVHTNKNTDFYLNGISILNCIKQKKAYKPYKEGNDSLSSLRTKVSILHECATTDKYIELTKLILYFNIVDINNRNCEITSEDFPYYKIGFTIRNNCSKNTPLHIACLSNSIKTMIYLLKHGASPIIKNNSGETPLHYCKNQNNLDFMMNYLSQNQNKKELYTSLLVSACKKGFTELIPYLTTKVDINTVVEKNETPIFFAPNINILKLLIKLGADINHQDSNGNTLLYKYAYTDEIYITKELIESGAKVDLKNRFGITCLDIGFRRKERKNMAIEYACNNLIKTIHLYSKTENGYFNEFKENVLNDENIFIDYISSYLNYFTM